jgi:hypothetical protein
MTGAPWIPMENDSKREHDKWMEKISKALQSLRTAGLRKARDASSGDAIRESPETARD